MIKIMPETENKAISMSILFSIFNKFFKLKPAIKKYIAVRKNAKKVDWLARTVRCNANFSLKIKSLFGLFSFIYFLLVLMPKGKYNGQKLINDVSIKTTAKTPSTIANVPLITFV